MSFTIVRQDITKMKIDAIVNAANTELAIGGGVCGAIFQAAGIDKLTNACRSLAPIKTGEAVITPGFELEAEFIIHTAGPIYNDGKHNEEVLLRNCYINSLKLAVDNNITSIAFPLISSGIYGYPKSEALMIAIDSIKTFIGKNEIEVYLVLFDNISLNITSDLYRNIETYISENYFEEISLKLEKSYMSTPRKLLQEDSVLVESEIIGFLPDLDESFSNRLFRLINNKKYEDVEVYKRANIDRKLFSKIKSNSGYVPSKKTVLAFAIALHLNYDETNYLLAAAGYTLSKSQLFDVIVEYFIVNSKYDIYEINEVLFSYDLSLLGGSNK